MQPVVFVQLKIHFTTDLMHLLWCFFAADGGAAVTHGFYACVICVRKKNLYPSVKAIQKVRYRASHKQVLAVLLVVLLHISMQHTETGQGTV